MANTPNERTVSGASDAKSGASVKPEAEVQRLRDALEQKDKALRDALREWDAWMQGEAGAGRLGSVLAEEADRG